MNDDEIMDSALLDTYHVRVAVNNFDYIVLFVCYVLNIIIIVT